MAFQYTPLPAGYFRLLKLTAPYHGGKYERLSFTLTKYSLSQAPFYTAVSYVWGSGPVTKEILVNGHPFPVRTNLWACLHYLTQYQNLNQDIWTHIWVDFICIDQSNVGERTQQVSFMDGIFAQATVVSAWLGNQNDLRYLFLREGAVTTFEIDEYMPSDHVPELANRTFWSRMWIVQEMILAKHVRLHIGGSSLDFADFAFLMEEYEGVHEKGVERILAYVKARSPDYGDISRPLLDLLLDFGSCQCQDPRDKVFALLGMIPSDERSILGRFFPDYSLTHDAVVVMVMSFLRDFSYEDINTKKDLIFDALGVLPSTGVRHRLWQASDFDALMKIQHLLERKTFDQVPAYLEIHDYNPLDDVVQHSTSQERHDVVKYSTSQERHSRMYSLITLPFRVLWVMVAYPFKLFTGRRLSPRISRAEDESPRISQAWARQFLQEIGDETNRPTRTSYGGIWES